MKNLILKAIIFVVLFLIPKMVFGNVIINEIAWMGTETSDSDEWIELYNDADTEINLSGWGLYEYRTGEKTLIEPLTGIIQGKSYYLIERTNEDTVPDIDASQTPTSWGGNGLNNNGEDIQLLDSNSSIIDEANCLSDWFAGENTTHQTMERSSAGWQTSLSPGGTPKAQNSSGAVEEPSSVPQSGTSEGKPASTANNPPIADAGDNIIGFVNQEIEFDGTQSSDPDNDELHYEWNMGDGKLIEKPSFTYKYLYPGTYLATLMVYDGRYYAMDTITVKIQAGQITINEFLPSPKGTDEIEEWIEIYNDSDEIVNISNWQLDDAASGSATFILPQNTLIAPKSYLVFSRQITDIALNNDQDSVRLLLPEGVVFQEINYEKPMTGKSSAHTAEGFVWAAPTPGAANIVNPSTSSGQVNKKFVYQQPIKPETTKQSTENYVINYQNTNQPEIQGGYISKNDQFLISNDQMPDNTTNELASVKPSSQNPINLTLLVITIIFGSALVGLLLIKFRKKALTPS